MRCGLVSTTIMKSQSRELMFVADMNEASNFCNWPCKNPFEEAITMVRKTTDSHAVWCFCSTSVAHRRPITDTLISTLEGIV